MLREKKYIEEAKHKGKRKAKTSNSTSKNKTLDPSRTTPGPGCII